jgi:hypothetical protein
MVVALAAFVVTPYDGLFFALQMAAVMLTLTREGSSALVLLAVVTALAAMTRETAYFIPAFYLAVHHRRLLAGDAHLRFGVLITGAIVVVTYAGLRLALGWDGASSVFYAWQAPWNLKWTSLTGSAMLAAGLILLTGDGPRRSARLCYAALALPYIVFVHLFAEPWEWRLWVPVLVPLLALAMTPEPKGSLTA